MHPHPACLVLLAILLPVPTARADRLAPGSAGAVTVHAADGGTADFAPEITVLFSAENPNLEMRWGAFPEPAMRLSDTGSFYNVLTWGRRTAGPGAKAQVEDGFDPAADRGYGAGRTANLFQAGRTSVHRAPEATREGPALVWDFPADPRVALRARLSATEDGTAPRLTITATAREDGWYSFGYTGAPAADPAKLDELWQPLIYTERRFPHESFLEAAYRCPLPTTLVTSGGITIGVAADAAEYPFEPLPNLANSRFGVALRDPAGKARPMLFAPILGGAGSRMKAGETRTFALRLIAARAPLTRTHERMARELYGFADVRRNALGSLNDTLERMIDFGLSEHAKFNADLRGFAYDTDVPGAVKNVSALHPLGVALVTDRRDIFERLARPLMEYFVSRERFLFTTDPKVKGQSASARLGGLGAPLTEYATLDLIAGGRTPFFRAAAESLFGRDRVLNLDGTIRGDNFSHALALYRATGERRWLDHAVKDADAYLARRVAVRQQDFSDPDSRGLFFWNAFTPQWVELLELHEETGERRFLEAARQGARDHALFVWLAPRIPDGDVRVHADGLAPAYRSGPRFPRIQAEPETVPAWRTSEIGLTSESAPTSKGARGIFLACHAPWMLRIAALTGDRLLHDIARSAIIGRYTSFPGYHLNTARNTAYEKPDFARRGKDELNSATSIHYNHIWPHIALLVDYLVTDAFAKSRGAVDFPGRYAEGYGYLQQKVYGDRPGQVHDRGGQMLWMPRGAVTIDHPELNFITARGENSFTVVLTNQSKSAVSATVALGSARLIRAPDARVAVWRENRPAGGFPLPAEGRIPVEVAAEGITVLVVDGARARVEFQDQALRGGRPLPAAGAGANGFRGARAVALRFGGAPGLTSVYAYLPDLDREVAHATLEWRQGAAAGRLEDAAFPFEFSVPVATDDPFEHSLTLRLKDGRTEQSPLEILPLR